MKPCTPPWLLAALGAASLCAGRDAMAADPSQWTCETCPFETGTTGTVDAGVGYVTEDSQKFGDYTGLGQKGAFAIAGATLRHRGADGYYADFVATDLGLDVRSIQADGGREGRWAYRLGYSEIPHNITDGASSPFIGNGGSVLTLPPGYPADTTAGMPLASTLAPVDIGYKHSRLDLGGTVNGPDDWQFRLDVRHDVRDGTQRSAGSFFSSTSQLVAPVDQTTDQVEAVAEYAGREVQASVGYRGSVFHNGDDSLTWQNPFTPLVPGATTGQLALPPDNEFHELFATMGYQFSPTLRASGEFSVGRMTQNQAFLASTLNSTLVVPDLPAASLDGHVDTLDATVRLTATPMDPLRIAASFTHNERDNKTSSLAYAQVTTDMTVGPAVSNLPYSFTRDLAKLEADWRGKGWKLAGGLDFDELKRTLQETGKTEEFTTWARGSLQPLDSLGLDLKLLHGQRSNDGYTTLASPTPQNPLMRKFNEADRRRNLAEVRADWSIEDGIGLGFNLDVTDDTYSDSLIGLTGAHSTSLGVDFSAAIAEGTQFRAYMQSEQIHSTMANSQQFSDPDWMGKAKDNFDTLGAGLTHAVMKGRLELAADLTLARAHNDTTIWFGSYGTPFPTVKTSLQSLTLSGTWHQDAHWTFLGSLAYEQYGSSDWHYDGVAPGTVPNLLALGEQAPHYNVGVIRFAARYRF
jgi:MtrB/PioB family decaheme-associated outer membrane protein